MSRAAHPVARLYQRKGGFWSDARPVDPTAEITAGYGRLLQAVPEHLLYRKPGAANRVQAAALAHWVGLIGLAQPHRFPDPDALAADRRVAAAAAVSCARSHPRRPRTPYCGPRLITVLLGRHAEVKECG